MDIRGAIAELQSLELWRLNEPGLQQVVADVHALVGAGESVLARAGAELERRGTASRLGVSSTRRLMADLTRSTPGRGGGWAALGGWLESHPEVAAALGGGSISVEHARIISSVLADLPSDLPVEATAACEAFLLDASRTDDPAALRRRGLELLDRLRPEDAADLEQEAVRRRELFIGRPVAGRVSLRGYLDTEAAELLHSVLSPLAAPRPALDGEQDVRSPARRNADALVDLVQRAADHHCVPGEGYTRPHITLTVSLDDLTTTDSAESADTSDAGGGRDPEQSREAGPGGGRDPEESREAGPGDVGPEHPSGRQPSPDGGRRRGGVIPPRRTTRAPAMAQLTFLGPLSRAAARRLACDAEVTPISLDEHLVPLDVGRSTYVVGGGLRRALVARDRGCAFPGCGRPPNWCDAHHITHWADGGHTRLTNLVLLCGFHHRRIHHDGWNVSIGIDNHPWFVPPPWVDPHRQTRPAHTRRPQPPLPTVA